MIDENLAARLLDAGIGDRQRDGGEGCAVILEQGQMGIACIDRDLAANLDRIALIGSPVQRLAQGCFLGIAATIDDDGAQKAARRIVGLIGFGTVIPGIPAQVRHGLARQGVVEFERIGRGRDVEIAVVFCCILLVAQGCDTCSGRCADEGDLLVCPPPDRALDIEAQARAVIDLPVEREGWRGLAIGLLVIVVLDFSQIARGVEPAAAAAGPVARTGGVEADGQVDRSDDPGPGDVRLRADATGCRHVQGRIPRARVSGAFDENDVHQACMSAHIVVRQGFGDELDTVDITDRNALQHGAERERFIGWACAIDQHIAKAVAEPPPARVAVGDREAGQARDHVQRRDR